MFQHRHAVKIPILATSGADSRSAAVQAFFCAFLGGCTGRKYGGSGGWVS
jgi:hypothetical protein